jgi:putative membrane protein
VFLVVWGICAIDPVYRADWFLESMLSFVAVPVAVVTYRWFRFSDRSYVLMTIFMVLHTIGSHYTYSEVPIGFWAKDALGLSRNHYDRVVHFSFGLLMLRPMRELGFRNARGLGAFAIFYFSAAGVGLWSLLYEILEWGVAAVADPTAGTAYLGTQGDQWDAQKDTGLAILGALLAAAYDFRRASREIGKNFASDAGAHA